ncbi:MAG: glycosyltransferase family 39 protein [Candidatus Levybacteria bacterium]|nr:glycosyltransferase family 39 protein [Candidatus Levybacteria bacterium]
MKLSKRVFLIIFFIIFILGSFLRFYQLGATPNSLNWDEVSWGYSAYSVLQTGKDEYGEAFPLSFRAFGDYKQPFYVYATILPVALFDLNAFSTRFPSAFFGSLSILFVFFLTFEIFRKEKYAKTVALLSMFFFAVSPWSIQFSRVAFEANVGLFFILLGSWFFIRGLHQKKYWYFFVSAVALSVSAYTYHSDKLFAPLLFVVLIIYGWKYFINKRVLTIILLIVFAFCNLFWLIDSRTTARGQGVLFTANKAQLNEIPIAQMQYDNEHGDPLGTLVHNRRVVIAQQYVTNYLDHFNPNWLFIKGDNPRHHAPSMGILYFANIAFILLGIFYLLKNKPYVSSILFAWLLLAPVASSLAVEAPNASRSLIFLPTWHIFEAFGWWYAYTSLKNTKLKIMLLIPLLFLFLNIIYFFHQYFVHTNTNFQRDWQFGYKEAVAYPKENTDKRTIFSKNLEQPYIFYLFYTKYSPEKYLKTGGSSRLNEKCYAIDNAYFGDCLDTIKSGNRYVSSGSEVLKKGKEIKRFNYQNGKPATTIYINE